MINSNTGFGKLKSVIVGRELKISKRVTDVSFNVFYKDNISKLDNYDHDLNGYSIDLELIDKRNEQLDNLAKILSDLGIRVFRPLEVTKVIQVKTPEFSSTFTSANNVRDLTLIYGNKIIETPPLIRSRYFENLALYKIFEENSDETTQWIKAPNTRLNILTLDLDDWNAKTRDFNNIPNRYEMAIDGAQFLRIGKDVIVNVTTYNHYLGLKWIKPFFPESEFHVISIADNHIDGIIHCLKPGVFLIDGRYKQILTEQLPDKFKTWKFITVDEYQPAKDMDVSSMTNINIQLASSRGMDINILSIDENTVLVNKRAYAVREVLEKNHFTVIPVELDNCEIFSGGIHCSTLDLCREDEYISYA